MTRYGFDVYIDENTLTCFKEPCASTDTEATFFLHLIPADEDDLPEERKQHSVIFDRKYLTKVSLPEYGISEIRTGQYLRMDSGLDNIWEEEIRIE